LGIVDPDPARGSKLIQILFRGVVYPVQVPEGIRILEPNFDYEFFLFPEINNLKLLRL